MSDFLGHQGTGPTQRSGLVTCCLVLVTALALPFSLAQASPGKTIRKMLVGKRADVPRWLCKEYEMFNASEVEEVFNAIASDPDKTLHGAIVRQAIQADDSKPNKYRLRTFSAASVVEDLFFALARNGYYDSAAYVVEQACPLLGRLQPAWPSTRMDPTLAGIVNAGRSDIISVLKRCSPQCKEIVEITAFERGQQRPKFRYPDGYDIEIVWTPQFTQGLGLVARDHLGRYLTAAGRTQTYRWPTGVDGLTRLAAQAIVNKAHVAMLIGPDLIKMTLTDRRKLLAESFERLSLALRAITDDTVGVAAPRTVRFPQLQDVDFREDTTWDDISALLFGVSWSESASLSALGRLPKFDKTTEALAFPEELLAALENRNDALGSLAAATRDAKNGVRAISLLAEPIDQRLILRLAAEAQTREVRSGACSLVKPQEAASMLHILANPGLCDEKQAGWATALAESVERISDQSLLLTVASRNRIPTVAGAAVSRLSGTKDLVAVAAKAELPFARESALRKLPPVELETLAKGRDESVAAAALAQIPDPDQARLLEVASGAEQQSVRDAALSRVVEQSLIRRLLSDGNARSNLRIAAAKRLIAREAELARLAATDADAGVRLAASARLSFSAALSEPVLWQRATALNSRIGHADYLKAYPRGPHAADARREAERIVWESAVKVNTSDAYQEYLTKYPKGSFAAEARLMQENPDVIEGELYFQMSARPFMAGPNAGALEDPSLGIESNGRRFTIALTARTKAPLGWNPGGASMIAPGRYRIRGRISGDRIIAAEITHLGNGPGE